tara:strand:- start:7 stop:519 length:513 start_codon:yes stop_codon:yes gene_type:complete
MKILENALSDEAFKDVTEGLDKLVIDHKQCWTSSALIWNKGVKRGVTGTTLITICDENITKIVEDEIKDYIPPYNELIVQYFLWQPLSSIPPHTDAAHKFGITIYLNECDDRGAGGWFMWEDDISKERGVTNALWPKKNMMVLNDEKEEHWVTTVSPLAPLRCTLQIWGH